MMNVGVLAASPKSDYFVFHDLDLFPLPGTSYHYPRFEHAPMQMAFVLCNYLQQFVCERLAYSNMGGVTMVSRELLLAINGWSNRFFGWGVEDDEMRARFVRLLENNWPMNNTLTNKFWHVDGVVSVTAGDFE
jgi:hypothetical protein